MRPAVIEAAMYGAMLASAWAYPPSRRYLRSLPIAWAAPLAVVFAMMLAGELMDRNRQAFPFVAWSMYGKRASGSTVWYEYTGLTATGEEVPLNPSRLYLSLGGGPTGLATGSRC